MDSLVWVILGGSFCRGFSCWCGSPGVNFPGRSVWCGSATQVDYLVWVIPGGLPDPGASSPPRRELSPAPSSRRTPPGQACLSPQRAARSPRAAAPGGCRSPAGPSGAAEEGGGGQRPPSRRSAPGPRRRLSNDRGASRPGAPRALPLRQAAPRGRGAAAGGGRRDRAPPLRGRAGRPGLGAAARGDAALAGRQGPARPHGRRPDARGLSRRPISGQGLAPRPPARPMAPLAARQTPSPRRARPPVGSGAGNRHIGRDQPSVEGRGGGGRPRSAARAGGRAAVRSPADGGGR